MDHQNLLPSSYDEQQVSFAVLVYPNLSDDEEGVTSLRLLIPYNECVRVFHIISSSPSSCCCCYYYYWITEETKGMD